MIPIFAQSVKNIVMFGKIRSSKMDHKELQERIEQFFELDLENCLLTRKDFCEIIASFIKDPIKTRDHYLEEINLYFEERS